MGKFLCFAMGGKIAGVVGLGDWGQQELLQVAKSPCNIQLKVCERSHTKLQIITGAPRIPFLRDINSDNKNVTGITVYERMDARALKKPAEIRYMRSQNFTLTRMAKIYIEW
ncbi:hypothetical protein [Microbulbifer taiwanensis]|uniref:Uncharacterized protein n=1 Tax=Microbulbifer taiwanensis TaxID=986746 RepID=A0ABW1YKT6_9GAMM|nr:hypothetical protein [Microbulbifer taiwanensis]